MSIHTQNNGNENDPLRIRSMINGATKYRKETLLSLLITTGVGFTVADINDNGEFDFSAYKGSNAPTEEITKKGSEQPTRNMEKAEQYRQPIDATKNEASNQNNENLALKINEERSKKGTKLASETSHEAYIKEIKTKSPEATNPTTGDITSKKQEAAKNNIALDIKEGNVGKSINTATQALNALNAKKTENDGSAD